jgi:hypothetical protein
MRLHSRQTKPGFWTDTELIRLFSREQRMFYHGLWQLADDSGCLHDDPWAFKLHLYPLDADITPEMLADWRDRLISQQKLIPYLIHGRRYLFLKNFHKHQSIANPARPDVPLPAWVIWRPYPTNGRQGTYTVLADVLTSHLQTSPACLTNPLQTPSNQNLEPEPEPLEPSPSETRQPAVAGDLSKPCSPQTVVGLWNEICGDKLPRVQRLTDGRRKKVRARMVDVGQDEAAWRHYFTRIRDTPFLMGDNGHRWTASFDWVIDSQERVAKILEGCYERSGSYGNKSGLATGGAAGAYTPDAARLAAINARVIDGGSGP